jgi:hypothetical protein
MITVKVQGQTSKRRIKLPSTELFNIETWDRETMEQDRRMTKVVVERETVA